MKKAILTIAAAIMTIAAMAQPKLTKDNIDDVINAMTLQEKASLLVGVRSSLVPGAAGYTCGIDTLASLLPFLPTDPPACV